MGKLLKAYAGSVKRKYGSKKDIIELKWLLLNENIKSSIPEAAFNGLTKENIPEELQFVLKEPNQLSREISIAID